jgi:hypothetical protein
MTSKYDYQNNIYCCYGANLYSTNVMMMKLYLELLFKKCSIPFNHFNQIFNIWIKIHEKSYLSGRIFSYENTNIKRLII